MLVFASEISYNLRKLMSIYKHMRITFGGHSCILKRY